MLTKQEFDILIKKTTSKSGCYLFQDINQNILYVGKANNIHKRIKQHWSSISENKKTHYMFNKITSWQTIITNNEKEAFILEHNLIKKYYPKFNILLIDDHVYPYIFISKKASDPRYLFLWSKIKEKGWYFGPFPDKYSGKKILTLLQDLFPLRRCSKKQKKQCLYYQIKKCSGACFKEVKKEYYQQQIKKVKNFFNGQVQKIKNEYHQKMINASQNLQFEQAQQYQKIINHIDDFVSTQTMEIKNCNDHHFINFAKNNEKIVITLFFYQHNKLQLKKEAQFNLFNNDIQETIEQYLQELYYFYPLPKYLILPKKIAGKIFEEIWGVKILYPQKGSKLKVLELLFDNAKELLEKKALKDQTIEKIKIIEKLQYILDLKDKLKKITFLDCSYQDQKIIVAAFTSYINGYWKKELNRYYYLKTNKKDEHTYYYLAVKEHYQKETLPNLLILDGSFAQLKGAQKGLHELRIKTSLISLTKNKKHRTKLILKEDGTKITLDHNQKLLNFLQKIQESGDQYAKKILINKNKRFIKN